MINNRAQIIKGLTGCLNLEIRLYTQYIEILEKEEIALTKFSYEDVAKASSERENFHTLILGAQARRIELLTKLNEGDHSGLPVLSEVIKKYCSKEEAMELNQLAERLKTLVYQTKERTEIHGQLAGFSLGMVNSLISIVYSATQSVLDLYTPQGIRKQAYQPTASRSAVACKV